MFFLRLSPLFFISKQLKQKIQTPEIDLESDSYTLVFMLVARLREDSFATYACSCRICPLAFFKIVFRLKKTIQKFQQANTKAIRVCYKWIHPKTCHPTSKKSREFDVGSTHEGLYSADISLFQQNYLNWTRRKRRHNEIKGELKE